MRTKTKAKSRKITGRASAMKREADLAVRVAKEAVSELGSARLESIRQMGIATDAVLRAEKIIEVFEEALAPALEELESLKAEAIEQVAKLGNVMGSAAAISTSILEQFKTAKDAAAEINVSQFLDIADTASKMHEASRRRIADLEAERDEALELSTRVQAEAAKQRLLVDQERARPPEWLLKMFSRSPSAFTNQEMAQNVFDRVVRWVSDEFEALKKYGGKPKVTPEPEERRIHGNDIKAAYLDDLVQDSGVPEATRATFEEVLEATGKP